MTAPKDILNIDIDGEKKKELARLKQIADKRRDDWRCVLATAEGRRVLWSIMADAGTFKPSFLANAPDVTAHNEGARSVGVKVWTRIIDARQDAFHQMQREHKSNAVMQEIIDNQEA